MNKVVYYILFYIMFVITYFLNIYLIKYTINMESINNKRALKVLLFFLFASICCFIDAKNYILLKNIIIYLSIIVFIKIFDKYDMKKIIMGCIYVFSVGIINELVSGLIYGFFLKVDMSNEYLVLLIKTICFLQYFFLTIIIVKIIRNIRKGKHIWLYTFKLFIPLFVLFIVIGSLNYLSTIEHDYMIYYLFIVLLIFIIIGAYIITRLLIINNNRKNEVKYLKDKNNEVIKYIDEFKTYKHNLRYKLLSIKEYGNKKVNQQLDKLLSQNNNELIFMNYYKELPSALIHIFSDRLSLNNDNNIRIIVHNSLDNKELIIKEKYYLSLYEIIGNALTNSIESVSEINPFIYIFFYINNNNQIIKIVNNFDNNVDVGNIGNKNYSTKNRNSGFGLYSIFNNNINVKTEIKNNLFSVMIIIPK